MDLSSSAIYGAIAFFVLIYYHFLWSRPSKSKQDNIPEVGGAKLFTGHLHLLGDTGDGVPPHVKLGTLAEKHGPVFSIRLGVNRALVVSNWDFAKELFTTHDITICSRPRMRAAKHLGYNFAMFGFSPYGPYWRELRKLVSLELLSIRRTEMQNQVRVAETTESIKELYKLWEERKDGSGRALVDFKQWFGDLNLNVIMRLVAGKRVYGGIGGAAGDHDAKETRRVFRSFVFLAGTFVAADAMPYLGWLDIGGYEKRMKETARELSDIVGGWLRDHREYRESPGFNKDKPRDFMDVMLSVVEGEKFPAEYDTDTIIKSTCQSLISGGGDTTSVMLVWALTLLLNNREVLKKAQEELDHHVGRERRVNESDINNLVYLQAIAKETLRLYPAAPLSAAREFTADSVVRGQHIPKGTWLLFNLWKLQRDPEMWPDEPLKFKPERFLTTYKNLDVRGQYFELIPFGAGRRICPGANFGLETMHIVLANVLQAFEFSTVGDQMVDMTETAGLTNMKPTPLEALVAPRLSPSLY